MPVVPWHPGAIADGQFHADAKELRPILVFGLEIDLKLQRVANPLVESQAHGRALGLQLGVVAGAGTAWQIHDLRRRGARAHHAGVDRVWVGVNQFPIRGLDTPFTGLGPAQAQFARLVQKVGAAELEQRRGIRIADAVVESKNARRGVVVVQTEGVVLVVDRAATRAAADNPQTQADRRLGTLDLAGRLRGFGRLGFLVRRLGMGRAKGGKHRQGNHRVPEVA